MNIREDTNQVNIDSNRSGLLASLVEGRPTTGFPAFTWRVIVPRTEVN